MKKILPLLCSLLIPISFPAASAFAETDIEICKYYSQSETENIAGKLSVTIEGGRNIEVEIQEKTKEGILTHYDTVLGDGTYNFMLRCNEYGTSDDTYHSSYILKLCDSKDHKSEYEIKNITVADNAYNNNITFSEYKYTIHSEESSERKISAEIDEPSVKNGILTGGGAIDIKCVSYILGDVNNDLKVDAKDATAVLIDYASTLLGKKSALDSDASDVNSDGYTDSKDATMILVYYAESILNKNIGTLQQYKESLQ